jgi:hypothetical protein
MSGKLFSLHRAAGERAGVRGRAKQLTYYLQHTFRVRQHVGVPEAHDSKSSGFQEERSGTVVSLLLGMLSAIEFHDQFLRDAHEVDDDMLPPELFAGQLTVTQSTP